MLLLLFSELEIKREIEINGSEMTVISGGCLSRRTRMVLDCVNKYFNVRSTGAEDLQTTLANI